MTYYPGADRSLYFGTRGGSPIKPNVVVLHSTEGGTVYDYNKGGVAPHITVDVKRRKVWQHIDLAVSARALVNKAGGVETNTLNCIQIEILGTCDPRSAVRPRLMDFTDADLQFLGSVLAQLHSLFPSIPLVSTTKPWVAYPASYDRGQGQRMSFAEWNGFKGICGHQHVPENVHGDPGNLNVDRILFYARGAKATAGTSASPVKTSSSTVAPASGAGRNGPIAITYLRRGQKPTWSVARYKQVLMQAHGAAYRTYLRTKFRGECTSQTWGPMAEEATRALYKALGAKAGDKPGQGWLEGDLSTPGRGLLEWLGFTVQ